MQASIIKKGQKGKGLKNKGLNIIILSSFNNNKFFEGVFVISGLSITNIMGSKIEDIYQNTMKDI